jgi:hypothetical protein
MTKAKSRQLSLSDGHTYVVGWDRVGFERAFRSIAPSLRQAMAEWCLGVFAVGTLGSVIRYASMYRYVWQTTAHSCLMQSAHHITGSRGGNSHCPACMHGYECCFSTRSFPKHPCRVMRHGRFGGPLQGPRGTAAGFLPQKRRKCPGCCTVVDGNTVCTTGGIYCTGVRGDWMPRTNRLRLWGRGFENCSRGASMHAGGAEAGAHMKI